MKKILYFGFLFLGFVNVNAQDLISGGSNSWIFHTPDDGRTTLHIAPKTNGLWDWGKQLTVFNDGKLYVRGPLGIGRTNTGSYKLYVNGSSFFNGSISNKGTNIGQQMERGNSAITTLRFDADRYRLYAGGSGGTGEIFTVKENGNIGIGITNPNEKLAVNGKIHAKEVKVDLIGWPDYVFKKRVSTTNYKRSRSLY